MGLFCFGLSTIDKAEIKGLHISAEPIETRKGKNVKW